MTMKKIGELKDRECLIFLSWQSDRKDCRNFVSSVVEKLPSMMLNLCTIAVDRDTINIPGSPDIGDTIFEKIDKCDLFIADITLINDKESGFRRTPNPNVLIELGYAIRTLGWERILLLQCKDYGDVEELPFDINHRRICNFTLGIDVDDVKEREKKKSISKNQVIQNISSTIALLIEKNLLFGGKKKKTPKFEITWKSNNGCMANLTFNIKNVSSVLISSLQSYCLFAVFDDKNIMEIKYSPRFMKTSLNKFEETEVQLNNQILGAGPGYNNAVWSNIELRWQFSCEDEENNIYWYEMKQYIKDADGIIKGIWPNKYIG